MTEPDEILDVRGLLCPLPVLKARKRLLGMSQGAVLRMEATDPASVIDVPHYCAESGNELIDQAHDKDLFTYWIRRV